jgi:hypothetical protein
MSAGHGCLERKDKGRATLDDVAPKPPRNNRFIPSFPICPLA